MSSRLYVGNLSFETNQRDLENLFSEVGSVSEALLIQDRESGASKGFGFVTMASIDDALHATRKLHGMHFHGRPLTISEAKPLVERSRVDHSTRGR